MNAIDILKAARQKIERPEAWTQGASARDARGSFVPANSSIATCFCMIGALSVVSDGLSNPLNFQVDDAENILRMAIGNSHIGVWNDDPDRTHAEVLAAFDKAIAACEAA